MIVTLAGVRDSCSGAREVVMTIWSVSMGNAGMGILLLTNLSSQRDRCLRGSGAHAPRLVPAEETDDGPRQVPDFTGASPASQLRAQRRIFAGFPLTRPRQTEVCGRHPGRPCCYGGNRRAVKLAESALF